MTLVQTNRCNDGSIVNSSNTWTTFELLHLEAGDVELHELFIFDNTANHGGGLDVCFIVHFEALPTTTSSTTTSTSSTTTTTSTTFTTPAMTTSSAAVTTTVTDVYGCSVPCPRIPSDTWQRMNALLKTFEEEEP
jgi:hypothetical protein